jgi:hypothetical protein
VLALAQIVLRATGRGAELGSTPARGGACALRTLACERDPMLSKDATAASALAAHAATISETCLHRVAHLWR